MLIIPEQNHVLNNSKKRSFHFNDFVKVEGSLFFIGRGEMMPT